MNKSDLKEKLMNSNTDEDNQKNLLSPDLSNTQPIAQQIVKERPLLQRFQDAAFKQFGSDWTQKEKQYANQLIQYCYNKAKENQKLWNAITSNEASFMLCISKAINYQLDVSAKDLFYIIPYEIGNTGKYNINFQLSYQGVLELAYRAGVRDVRVQKVYANDEFEVDFGLFPKLVHRPNISARDDEDAQVLCYYSIVTPSRGAPIFEIMTKKEVETHALQFSKTFARHDSFWKKNFDSMAMKTVLLKSLKWAPKSACLTHAIDSEFSTEDIKQLDSGE